MQGVHYLVENISGWVWLYFNIANQKNQKKMFWIFLNRLYSWFQISPPASINSIGFSRDWGLVAAGTAHGLVILDCFQKITILAKCTLNAHGKRLMFFAAISVNHENSILEQYFMAKYSYSSGVARNMSWGCKTTFLS